MEFNKPVSNPMLVGCIELLKAEDTPEHRNMFVAELLRANLLAPALIDPAPEEDEEGSLKLIPGSKIQFPLHLAPDGKQYFMAFTDEVEYQLWVERNHPCPTFAMVFDDYIGMMLHKDSNGNAIRADGIVVNPYGANLVMPKDMLAQIMGNRMIEILRRRDKKAAQKLRAPGSSITAPPEAPSADREG